MSEFGYVQRLSLRGFLSALLILGCGPLTGDAAAASLRQSVAFPFALNGVVQAQTAGEGGESSARETPDSGDPTLEDDVPFSELNEALTAARSRLAELTKAAEIAKVAGELREKLQSTEAENQQLKAVLSQLQSDNGELLSAQQTADLRIDELTKSAEETASEARRLDEELKTVRVQNGQLRSSLAQAETTASGAAEELSRVRDELGARAEELAELRQTAEESTADNTKLARNLDSTITELAAARTEVTTKDEALEQARIALEAAEQETGVLRTQLAGNRSETDELRGRLESAEIDLENYRTLNASLEQQVTLLKTAAGEATDAARQNLLAVENQINEINAALASVKADELLTGVGGPVIEEDGEGIAAVDAAGPQSRASRSDGWVPRPSPPRAGIREQLVAATPSDTIPARGAGSPLSGTDGRSPAAKRDAGTAAVSLASLTTELPASRRQDAEALLSKLKAAKDDRGLSMTVPGELLFAVDSDEIEPAAFDALASVARLVDLYGERDVLVVGHTDAVGDAGYNQQLSERRAALVKQYFVDNFQISPERFQVEGRGEQDPISSNATADGRNANRRVEVVILD